MTKRRTWTLIDLIIQVSSLIIAGLIAIFVKECEIAAILIIMIGIPAWQFLVSNPVQYIFWYKKLNRNHHIYTILAFLDLLIFWICQTIQILEVLVILLSVFLFIYKLIITHDIYVSEGKEQMEELPIENNI
jgi:hypothetical protein